MRKRYFLFVPLLPLTFFACGPESPTPMTPMEAKAVEVAPTPDASAPVAVEDAPQENPNPVTATTVNEDLCPLPEDPARRKFTLAQALEGLQPKGVITSTITTSLGTMKCKLFDDK